MEELMTIGEFSQRSGLSPKVLRTYAEVGVLVPATIDEASGYRYYAPDQLDDAEVVGLLRRAGIPVAEIGRFLASPSADALAGWERSLVAEVQSRRQALAEVRCRLTLDRAASQGEPMMDIRAVRDRSELREVFELLGSQFPGPITADDGAFQDLALRFPLDQPLMVVATADGSAVGGALAFREENDWVGLRILAVTEHFRHRGIGRRLVERVEGEAGRLGTDGVALGTDDAIGFFHHLGYTPNLLFQWVYDPERYAEESEAVLGGPLAGLHHWRSSFNGVPQLFVELDEPRLDLRHRLREQLTGCHVGFMLSKRLTAATAGKR